MFKAIFTRIVISAIIPLLIFLGSGSTVTSMKQADTVDFESILNLNYCYGDSFSKENIAVGSLLSLLEFADDNEGQRSLDQSQVDFFIKEYYFG